MISRIAVSLIAFVSVAVPVAAQDHEAPLAKGDSVRFSLTLREGEPTTYTGIVHEVKNQRNCFFIVTTSIEGPRFFSFGLFISRESEFTVERLHVDAEPQTVTVEALWDFGIRCVEGHPTPEPTYLSPDLEDDFADQEPG